MPCVPAISCRIDRRTLRGCPANVRSSSVSTIQVRSAQPARRRYRQRAGSRWTCSPPEGGQSSPPSGGPTLDTLATVPQPGNESVVDQPCQVSRAAGRLGHIRANDADSTKHVIGQLAAQTLKRHRTGVKPGKEIRHLPVIPELLILACVEAAPNLIPSGQVVA